MSEWVDQIYKRLGKKIEVIESSMKLPSCTEKRRQDFEIILKEFQNSIEETKQMVHDNIRMQEAVRDKPKEIIVDIKNRKLSRRQTYVIQNNNLSHTLKSATILMFDRVTEISFLKTGKFESIPCR